LVKIGKKSQAVRDTQETTNIPSGKNQKLLKPVWTAYPKRCQRKKAGRSHTI